MEESNSASHFNILNEGPLHAALKAWYARPDDRCEVPLEGYFIDIIQGDRLVEIQTRNFSAIKQKLVNLADRHPVRLVYPIPFQKWIVRLADDGVTRLSRRKSPKTGRVEQVFSELIRIPALLAHPNFSLEILFTEEEEFRTSYPPRGRWRKDWGVQERRLVQVVASRVFETPSDLAGLLPAGLDQPFTVRNLAARSGLPLGLARRMVYCLRHLEVLTPGEKRGRASRYYSTPPAQPQG